MADTETLLHSEEYIVLDITIKDSSRKNNNKTNTFFVIKETLNEILIGLEVLEKIGISPMQNLMQKQKAVDLLDISSVPDTYKNILDVLDDISDERTLSMTK